VRISCKIFNQKFKIFWGFKSVCATTDLVVSKFVDLRSTKCKVYLKLIINTFKNHFKSVKNWTTHYIFILFSRKRTYLFVLYFVFFLIFTQHFLDNLFNAIIYKCKDFFLTSLKICFYSVWFQITTDELKRKTFVLYGFCLKIQHMLENPM
jgi:hypothetical protein